MTDLLIETRDDVEVWTLHRPARRNAISLALIDALDRAREQAVARGTSAVVLTGAGDVFCAGFDLDDLRRLGATDGVLPASPLHQMLDRFTPLPFTLINAIQGPAIGGGVEVALLADLRVASPRATFLLPPAKLGIVYPEQGLTRLRAALGTSLLRAMLVSALPVPAARLEQLGALWAVADDPLAEARRLASHVASLPLHARLANARGAVG